MSYFILLVGCGTKYRTRLIITFPACQVHWRPAHLEPALCIWTIIPAQTSFIATVRLPVFNSWSNLTCQIPVSNAAVKWPSTFEGLARAQMNRSSDKLPRKGRMMINSILSISFMFNGCLGALDSNGMDDVVDHEYDTLPPSTLDARKATPGKF